MGKQELAAVEALARHFSARWDVGEGPHEAWLTIARKRVAVDVAGIKPRRDEGFAKPRLRFDRVALGFVEDLRAALRDAVPENKTMIVTVTAPIRQANKTAAGLVEKIRSAAARRPSRVELAETIHGNRIRARLAKGGGTATVVGFVHNPQPGAAELLLATTQALLACSAAAAANPAPAKGERWLVVADNAGLLLSETYRSACSQLPLPPGFGKILLVSGKGRVETLAG